MRAPFLWADTVDRSCDINYVALTETPHEDPTIVTSPSIELDDYLAFADQLAGAARKVIKSYFRSDFAVDNKPADTSMGQPVTLADQESEQVIRDLIQKTYPDHGIIGEEHGTVNEDADFVWVLDPIDGTRAFITGLPVFGTLIGLMYQGRPIVGVIDQPVMDDRFVGSAKGTWHNGRAVKTRACAHLTDAVFAITDPRMMKTPAEQAVFERVIGDCAMAQFGGNCYHYAMLAAGAIDLITEGNLKLWDICALVPVIEGAGGVITGWDGGRPEASDGLIVACGDPALHNELLPLLKGAA